MADAMEEELAVFNVEDYGGMNSGGQTPVAGETDEESENEDGRGVPVTTPAVTSFEGRAEHLFCVHTFLRIKWGEAFAQSIDAYNARHAARFLLNDAAAHAPDGMLLRGRENVMSKLATISGNTTRDAKSPSTEEIFNWLDNRWNETQRGGGGCAPPLLVTYGLSLNSVPEQDAFEMYIWLIRMACLRKEPSETLGALEPIIESLGSASAGLAKVALWWAKLEQARALVALARSMPTPQEQLEPVARAKKALDVARRRYNPTNVTLIQRQEYYKSQDFDQEFRRVQDSLTIFENRCRIEYERLNGKFLEFQRRYALEQKSAKTIYDDVNFFDFYRACRPVAFDARGGAGIQLNDEQTFFITLRNLLRRPDEFRAEYGYRASDQLPTVFINHWGTGTGKTYSACVFLETSVYKNVYIVVHSSAMVRDVDTDQGSTFYSSILKYYQAERLRNITWFVLREYTDEKNSNVLTAIALDSSTSLVRMSDKDDLCLNATNLEELKKKVKIYTLGASKEKTYVNQNDIPSNFWNDDSMLRKLKVAEKNDEGCFVMLNWATSRSIDFNAKKKNYNVEVRIDYKKLVHIMVYGGLFDQKQPDGEEEKQATEAILSNHKEWHTKVKPQLNAEYAFVMDEAHLLRNGGRSKSAKDSELNRWSSFLNFFTNNQAKPRPIHETLFMTATLQANNLEQASTVIDSAVELTHLNDDAYREPPAPSNNKQKVRQTLTLVKKYPRVNFSTTFNSKPRDNESVPGDSSLPVVPPKSYLIVKMKTFSDLLKEKTITIEQSSEIYDFMQDVRAALRRVGVVLTRALSGGEGMPVLNGERMFLAPTTTPGNMGLLYWPKTPIPVEVTHNAAVEEFLTVYNDILKRKEQRRKGVSSESEEDYDSSDNSESENDEHVASGTVRATGAKAWKPAINDQNFRRISSAFVYPLLPAIYTETTIKTKTVQTTDCGAGAAELFLYAHWLLLRMKGALNDSETIQALKKYRPPKKTNAVVTFSDESLNSYDEFYELIVEKVHDNLYRLFQPKMDRLVKDVLNAGLRPVVIFVENVTGVDSVLHLLYSLEATGVFKHITCEQTEEMAECISNKTPHEGRFLYSVALYGGSECNMRDVHSHKSAEERNRLRSVFNSEANKRGAFVRVLVITRAGSTGITLENTHNVFFLGPYQDITVGLQYEGRCVRRTARANPPTVGGFPAHLSSDGSAVVERPVVTMVGYKSNIFAGFKTWDQKTFEQLQEKVYAGNLQSILFTWCALNARQVVQKLVAQDGAEGTSLLEPLLN